LVGIAYHRTVCMLQSTMGFGNMLCY
jgi:hypothetical protein